MKDYNKFNKGNEKKEVIDNLGKPRLESTTFNVKNYPRKIYLETKHLDFYYIMLLYFT